MGWPNVTCSRWVTVAFAVVVFVGVPWPGRADELKATSTEAASEPARVGSDSSPKVAQAELTPQQRRAKAIATVEAIYAEKIGQVAESPDAKDNMALAAELLEIAVARGMPTEVSLVLAERAFGITVDHPEATDVALRAAKLGTDLDPQSMSAWRERTLPILERNYKAAEGEARLAIGQKLAHRLRALAERHERRSNYKQTVDLKRRALEIARQLKLPDADKLEAELQQSEALLREYEKLILRIEKAGQVNADADVWRSIVIACLVDLNSPRLAIPHLGKTGDKTLQELVPFAARPLDRIDATALAELGGFYRSLLEHAKQDNVRLRLLERAASYYAAYLSTVTENSFDRVKVTLGLKQANEQIAALREKMGIESPQAADAPVDVLKTIRPKVHRQGGTVVLAGDKLVIESREVRLSGISWGRCFAPVEPPATYTLKASFTLAGVGPAHMVLPVDGRAMHLQIGARGKRPVVVLNTQGHKDAVYAASHDSEAIERPEQGTYEIEVVVKHTGEGRFDLLAVINGQEVIRLSTYTLLLEAPEAWAPPKASYIGLGVGKGRVIYSSIVLHPNIAVIDAEQRARARAKLVPKGRREAAKDRPPGSANRRAMDRANRKAAKRVRAEEGRPDSEGGQ